MLENNNFETEETQKLIDEAIKKYSKDNLRDEKGRFKKGNSGNKKGRPHKKELNNITDILNSVLKEKTSLKILKTKKQANLLDALIYKLITQLLNKGTPYQIIKFLITFSSDINLEVNIDTKKNSNNETFSTNSQNPGKIMRDIYQVMDKKNGINRIPEELLNQKEENNDNE